MKSVIKLVPEDPFKKEGGKITIIRIRLHLRKNILIHQDSLKTEKADDLFIMEVLSLGMYQKEPGSGGAVNSVLMATPIHVLIRISIISLENIIQKAGEVVQ